MEKERSERDLILKRERSEVSTYLRWKSCLETLTTHRCRSPFQWLSASMGTLPWVFSKGVTNAGCHHGLITLAQVLRAGINVILHADQRVAAYEGFTSQDSLADITLERRNQCKTMGFTSHWLTIEQYILIHGILFRVYSQELIVSFLLHSPKKQAKKERIGFT